MSEKLKVKVPKNVVFSALFGTLERTLTSDLPLRSKTETFSPNTVWSITTLKTLDITGFSNEHDIFSWLVFLLISADVSYSY